MSVGELAAIVPPMKLVPAPGGKLGKDVPALAAIG